MLQEAIGKDKKDISRSCRLAQYAAKTVHHCVNMHAMGRESGLESKYSNRLGNCSLLSKLIVKSVDEPLFHGEKKGISKKGKEEDLAQKLQLRLGNGSRKTSTKRQTEIIQNTCLAHNLT